MHTGSTRVYLVRFVGRPLLYTQVQLKTLIPRHKHANHLPCTILTATRTSGGVRAH